MQSLHSISLLLKIWFIIKLMIKIESNKSRYLPTKRKLNQKKFIQTHRCKTQSSTFVMQEQFKTITEYIKFFQSMQVKNRTLKTTQYDSLCLPKHRSNRKVDIQPVEERNEQIQQCYQPLKNTSDAFSEFKTMHKRYSCLNSEPNHQRNNWIKTILRRKNNGSYGQIVRGLTGVKHDTILEKAQAVSSHRQGRDFSPLGTDLGQKFVPLGSSKYKNQPTFNRRHNKSENKNKMRVNKKKTKMSAAEYFQMNIKIRSTCDQSNQEAPKTSESGERYANLSKLMKKKSEPYKIERHNLSPWDDI